MLQRSTGLVEVLVVVLERTVALKSAHSFFLHILLGKKNYFSSSFMNDMYFLKNK